MATLAAILAAIGSIGAIVSAIFAVWKNYFYKTPQEKVDETKRQTDKEQQDFKDGKGGSDAQV